MTIGEFRTAANVMSERFGADAVLQSSTTSPEKVSLTGAKWQRLGTRTKEFKQRNMEVRQQFVDALSEELNGLSMKDLPPALAKALKAADFKLDAKGKVTSTRPLTARRVLTITNALSELSDREKSKFREIDTLDKKTRRLAPISTFDKITVAREAAVKGSGVDASVALMALDTVAEARRGSLSLPKFGSPDSRIDGLVDKIANSYMNKMYAVYLDKLEDEEMQTLNPRYGGEEAGVGGEAAGALSTALLKICMARDPSIAQVIKRADLKILQAKSEAAGKLSVDWSVECSNRKTKLWELEMKIKKSNDPTARAEKKNEDDKLKILNDEVLDGVEENFRVSCRAYLLAAICSMRETQQTNT